MEALRCGCAGQDCRSVGDGALRVRLPQDLAPPGPAYVDRLRPVSEMHGEMTEDRFRRFVEVHLHWDEHMARVAGDYLQENPDKTLVILAGSGHVAYPTGGGRIRGATRVLRSQAEPTGMLSAASHSTVLKSRSSYTSPSGIIREVAEHF